MSERDERRARELMLAPADKAAYLALMTGERGEYQVVCRGCGQRVETYETHILRHVRSCQQLRAAAGVSE